jgi:hypothetical protein
VTGGRVGLLVNRNLFRAGARDGLGERMVLGEFHHANTGWAVEALLGDSVGTSMMSLGALDGTDVGCASVGIPLGALDGTDVGKSVGVIDGMALGVREGSAVGIAEGTSLCIAEGNDVGMSVGATDGMALGVK